MVRKISILVLLVAVALIAIAFLAKTVHSPTVEKPIEKTAMQFEIVDTEAKRSQGLSGRMDVPSGYGMLFVFPSESSPGFWMEDMLVSIDIIWLSDDGTILGIEHSVSPRTYPKPFYPPKPIRLVLETRAGEAKARGWDIGTRIPLPETQ